MKLLSLVMLVAMAWAQAPIPPVPVPSTIGSRWRIKFFHDRNDTSIDFRELLVPDPQTVCAFGILIEDDGKPRGVLVNSRDSGKSWQTHKLPDLPRSADFLDASNGWLVTQDAVHKTVDGGLTWKRSAKLKGVLRVKFLTAQKGFAVGYPMAVWTTADGGTTWTKVPEADKHPSPERSAGAFQAKPENTTYNTVTFLSAKQGIITGFSRPPRRDEPRVPAWMDPELQKRLTPSLTIAMQTQDGGATWTSQAGSVFGQTTKIVFSKSVGLGLIEYTAGSFSYASEVINVLSSKSVFIDKERAIRDIAFDGDGRAWVAGVAINGTLNQLPIPSKLVIMQSIDLQHWYAVPADYKAVANRVKIAFSGKSGWVATDGGMILALE